MRDEEFKGINVVPLVDIMLVLLVIVLTTATFIATGNIPVKLPEAETSQSRAEQETIRIRLTKDGEIYLGSRRVDAEQLGKLLGNRNRETPVEVWSDKRAEVKHLVKLMETLRKLRFKNLSLVVVRKDG